MRHQFRKYIGNRGSALFMVISTMTALLVSCMAMYFSVVSSRQSQFAVFNKQQSHQSAQSIVDIVRSSIADPSNAGGQALLAKLKGLNVGESISTSANGFKSLDPNNPALTNNDESTLGAYSVTITRIEDTVNAAGNSMAQFDICVISSVDGNKDAVHQSFAYNENSTTEPGGGSFSPGDSELFTATGYVPNDAYLDGGYFLTNTFFDTEFTYAGAYNPKSNYLAGNISTGGNFILKGYIVSVSSSNDFKKLEKPTIWSIRGDFDVESPNPLELYEGSKIIVGRNMTFTDHYASFQIGGTSSQKNIDIYVLGDLALNNGGDFSNCNLYVNGDVKLGSWSSFKNLYVNGTISGSSYTKSGEEKKWSEASDSLSKDDIINELMRRTDSKTYNKWEIPDSQVDAANPIHIRLNSDNHAHDGVDAFSNNFYFAYPDSETALDTSIDPLQRKVGKGFTVDGFDGASTNNDTPLAIVIDTGNDVNNIVTIRVMPYIDVDGDGVKETFAWRPYFTPGSTDEGSLFSNPFGVIVKGRGSVIIDVPSGTVYQAMNRDLTLHYSWFKLLGGVEEDKTTSREDLSGNWGDKTYHCYNVQPITSGQSVPTTDGGSGVPSLLTAQLIHSGCHRGDGCSYTFPTGTEKCPICNGYYTEIVCSKHGKVDYYCPTCNTPKQDKVDKWNDASTPGRVEGFCDNRLDKSAVDQYLNEHPSIKSDISDGSGVIYPNVNIYMVTCSESTEVRFATDVAGRAIKQNGFYGYIYAPYVTYKGEGDSCTMCARFCGGLVVSEYIFNDNYPVIACYPDKMPQELAAIGGGNISGGLAGKTSKSWKIDIGSYR